MINLELILLSVFFMMFMLLITILFKNINALNMSINLILYTIFTIIFMSSMKMTYYNLLIFMLMIGGLMIIFMYFSSLSPKHSMSLNNYSLLMMKLISVMILLSVLMKKHYFTFFKYMNSNIMLSSMNNFILNKQSIYNLFQSPNYKMIIILFILILIILLMVVKTCSQKNKPMRKMK